MLPCIFICRVSLYNSLWIFFCDIDIFVFLMYYQWLFLGLFSQIKNKVLFVRYPVLNKTVRKSDFLTIMLFQAILYLLCFFFFFFFRKRVSTVLQVSHMWCHKGKQYCCLVSGNLAARCCFALWDHLAATAASVSAEKMFLCDFKAKYAS